MVVHSTIAPERRADEFGAGRWGLAVLDAPVSGGPMGAADGTLAIMVGGDEASYAVVPSRSWHGWAARSSTPDRSAPAPG